MSLEKLDQMQNETWREWFLAIQGFFYFAQGAAFAAILLIPVILINEYGIADETALTYQSIIMIPWYIKLLYGLLSDNVSFKKLGRRKPYILIAGVLGLVGWFVLPSFKTFNAGFLVIGILLSLSIALSDAVIDSIAVDITPKKRRGWMQGVGWGGRGAGTAVTGLIFFFILDKVPWGVAFYIAGALIVLGCVLALFYQEPEILSQEELGSVKWDNYKVAFKDKKMWITTLFMILSGAGIAIISTFTTFLNQTTTIDLNSIGLGTTFFALGQFVGALIIGGLGDLLPLTPVLFLNTAFYIVGIMLLIVIPYNNLIIIYLIVGIIGAINGGYEATQMRIGMEYSQGPIAGSMYNWYMSMSNIGQIALGAVIIGQLATLLGGYQYSMQTASVFLLLAVIPAVFLIKWLREKEKKQKPSEEKEIRNETESAEKKIS
jgi:MFS family permease